ASESLEEDINKVKKDIAKADKIKDEQKKYNQLENLNNRMNKLQGQLDGMLEIKRTHPDGVLLSGALYAQSGHKSYYLYGEIGRASCRERVASAVGARRVARKGTHGERSGAPSNSH